jgi:hypothetical protein
LPPAGRHRPSFHYVPHEVYAGRSADSSCVDLRNHPAADLAAVLGMQVIRRASGNRPIMLLVEHVSG